MKTRRQRLFDGFALVSLTLLLLTAAMCAAGFLHPGMVHWESTRARVFFVQLDGWNLAFAEQSMISPNARGSVVFDATHLGKLIAATAGGTQSATLSFGPASMPTKGILGFGSFTDFSPTIYLLDQNGAKVRIQAQ